MRFQGVFAIPVTPFAASGELDERGLRRQVRFCHSCGVHGIVAPVNASEFYTLSDDERKRVVEIVAAENAGRVPFVAGCSAVSAPHAAMLARHARVAGADGVIAMPPVIRKASDAEIVAYYELIAEAAGVPVVVQDYLAPIGTPMSAELLARLLREIPGVDYLKEETALGPHVISRVRKLAGDDLKGVMGGQGGRFLFNEVARGACGTMPACHTADVLVDLWNSVESGRTGAARELFQRLLPLFNFEQMYGIAAYKEVLVRRGIIDTALCRGAPAALDAIDLAELDVILAALAPMYRAGQESDAVAKPRPNVTR